ncbi:MAG: RES domain-containing protein [Bryobacterales bacterium]|nr:RES domain-containing protein [Bryobacterales bacterium]
MSSTAFPSKRVLEAYRIGSLAHPLLDGGGAAVSDTARWNSRGRFVIYAAECYTGALLEKAAQLNSLKIPRTLVYMRIEIPAGATVEEVKLEDLPGWDSENRTASQRYGDAWYDEARSLALLVPSLVAPGLERNILINQRHPEFATVRSSTPESIRCHPRLLV